VVAVQSCVSNIPNTGLERAEYAYRSVSFSTRQDPTHYSVADTYGLYRSSGNACGRIEDRGQVNADLCVVSCVEPAPLPHSRPNDALTPPTPAFALLFDPAMCTLSLDRLCPRGNISDCHRAPWPAQPAHPPERTRTARTCGDAGTLLCHMVSAACLAPLLATPAKRPCTRTLAQSKSNPVQ